MDFNPCLKDRYTRAFVDRRVNPGDIYQKRATTGMVPVVVMQTLHSRCSAGIGLTVTPSARGGELLARQRQLREHPAKSRARPGPAARSPRHRGSTLRANRAVNNLRHE